MWPDNQTFMKNMGFPRWTTLVVLLALANTLGCAGFSSGSSGNTGKQQNVVGQIAVAPANVNFGSVQVGSKQSLPASITNPSSSSVTITQATTTGTGYSVAGLSLPLSLAAGKTQPFTVIFTPQSASNSNGSVTIVNDGSTPNINVPLSGNGLTAGALTASPSSLSFGNVQVGNHQATSETLTNSSQSVTVTISQAAISGTGFSMSGLTPPVVLGPGQQVTFGVSFAPQSAGNAGGSISVTSNASDPNLAIPLTGNGTNAPAGQLVISPTSFDFGSVDVGSYANLPAQLSATGASVTVSSGTTSNSAFTLSGVSFPVTIPPGQNVQFVITFTPPSAGQSSGTASFTSNAANSPTVASLSGTGQGSGGIPFSKCTPGGPGIPCTYWGMHVNELTSYPLQVPYGQFRGWDSAGANWPQIAQNCQPSSGPTDPCFEWSNLDSELAKVKQGNVNDVFYALSRTPPWAVTTPEQNNPNCAYFSLGAIFHGACYPPVDLNADGSGADQIWRNWVAAIALRVNDPSYMQSHAHIKYWEIWNEVSRSSLLENTTTNWSYEGTYNQLVRLAEDTRCIITGKGQITSTGETCEQVLLTVGLSAAVDPNAVMVAPSSAGINVDEIENFLHCDHSPKALCTTGSAGFNAIDVVDVHLYVTTTTPESYATQLPAVFRMAAGKPVWNGEGSWGDTSVQGNIWASDAYARAGFIARYFSVFWSAGVTENFWYGYDYGTVGALYNFQNGQLKQPEANAWILTYNWLTNASPVNDPFCQVNGTIYNCDFTDAAGHAASLVWDSSYGQNCSSMSVPIVCGNTNYNVPSQFDKDWIDLTGTVHQAASTVAIGANPILLEGQ